MPPISLNPDPVPKILPALRTVTTAPRIPFVPPVMVPVWALVTSTVLAKTPKPPEIEPALSMITTPDVIPAETPANAFDIVPVAAFLTVAIVSPRIPEIEPELLTSVISASMPRPVAPPEIVPVLVTLAVVDLTATPAASEADIVPVLVRFSVLRLSMPLMTPAMLPLLEIPTSLLPFRLSTRMPRGPDIVPAFDRLVTSNIVTPTRPPVMVPVLMLTTSPF